MTNPTPTNQDREMAEKLAEQVISIPFGYATNLTAPPMAVDRQHVATQLITQAITTARLQGRREGLEEAAKALEADAKLCDCHAKSEDECACGAWCEWKTVPMHRAVEIVRALNKGQA